MGNVYGRAEKERDHVVRWSHFWNEEGIPLQNQEGEDVGEERDGTERR